MHITAALAPRAELLNGATSGLSVVIISDCSSLGHSFKYSYNTLCTNLQNKN